MCAQYLPILDPNKVDLHTTAPTILSPADLQHLRKSYPVQVKGLFSADESYSRLQSDKLELYKKSRERSKNWPGTIYGNKKIRLDALIKKKEEAEVKQQQIDDDWHSQMKAEKLDRLDQVKKLLRQQSARFRTVDSQALVTIVNQERHLQEKYKAMHKQRLRNHEIEYIRARDAQLVNEQRKDDLRHQQKALQNAEIAKINALAIQEKIEKAVLEKKKVIIESRNELETIRKTFKSMSLSKVEAKKEQWKEAILEQIREKKKLLGRATEAEEEETKKNQAFLKSLEAKRQVIEDVVNAKTKAKTTNSERVAEITAQMRKDHINKSQGNIHPVVEDWERFERQRRQAEHDLLQKAKDNYMQYLVDLAMQKESSSLEKTKVRNENVLSFEQYLKDLQEREGCKINEHTNVRRTQNAQMREREEEMRKEIIQKAKLAKDKAQQIEAEDRELQEYRRSLISELNRKKL